jgi:cell division protein FtsL
MAKKKKNKGFRLIHLVIIALLVYVAIVYNHQRNLMKDLNTKKSENLAKLEQLEKDIDALNKEIEKSGTLEFVEKVARDELGMVKPREIIYIDKNKSRNPLFDIFKKDN